MPSPQTMTAIYEDELRRTAYRSAQVIACCALGLVPLFAYLDTITFPDHEPLFLILRLTCMAIALGVLFASRTPFGRRYPLHLATLMPLAVGLDVDLMTMLAGRETNPYYAGVIVVLLAAALVIPWPPLWALVVSGVLVGVYTVGTVATGPITHVPLFMTNVFLLFSTAVLVVIGAAMGERLRRREFESRMRLNAHARRQQAIATLGQLALGAVGSSQLLECAVTIVAETLGVEIASVFEVDASTTTLILRAGVGWSPNHDGRTIIDAAPGSLGAFALASRAPVVIEDLPSERRFEPAAPLIEQAIVSNLIVAIGGRDRPFGVLGAHTAMHRTFTRKEVAFLDAVAAVLTTAIVREQAESALTEEMHTSAALARVAQELISSLETPVLLERLCQSCAEVLGADYSNTWLWNSEEQLFTPISGYGLAAEEWEALRSVPVPTAAVTPLVARLTRDEIAYLTPTSAEVPLVAGLVARHHATLAVCIAFRRGEEMIGVQVAGYRGRVRPYSVHEDRLARGIAQLASMALTNARLVEELERASRLKSEFVSTMSHELRTPLNVIIGYTDMLADDLAVDDRALMIAHVRKSSLELLEMVEATLTLNRIAAGKDLPQLEMVDVRGLWLELEDDFVALPRPPQVAVRFEPVGAVAVWTDRRKLKIVLKNLIGNALKFTSAGEIVASCRAGDGGWIFTVRDTGIGIPPAHLPQIFEMFRQVDSSDARSYGGAGLGLYIVKRLLSQLGGDVEVASEIGRGSTFTVRLPARPAADVEASFGESVGGDGGAVARSDVQPDPGPPATAVKIATVA